MSENINKKCCWTKVLMKLIRLRWSGEAGMSLLKAVVYWSLWICKSLVILGREKLMLISWGNSPWWYKLSTSSLAGAVVAVDCAAFCCLASCAVYCVLRLERSDCVLTACMLVRHTTSPSSMPSVPIHSIPAWQNYESDSLSKSFDVKTVYIWNYYLVKHPNCSLCS